MSDEFLAAVKGYKHTSVIHSNQGPNAAAAMMGMMAARSQAAGPYFRVSDQFIPNVESLAIEDSNIDSAPDQIDINFKNDWMKHLRSSALPACSLTYNDSLTPQENTIRFLNAHSRIPAIRPRIIHESRELSIPSELRPDYERLVTLIRAGGDLRPYLSRQIATKNCPDKNDGLLNSWGIQHLHFRREGTEQVVFCVIEEADVFMIQALPHDPKPWANTQLIQILHDNWPALIAGARHSGLRPEEFSATKRDSLRNYNANFAITVSDGTVYLPPAGGTLASGDSNEDWVNCKKIFSELDYWQSIIIQQVLAIRAALNMPASKKLVVRMAYDNRDCCFYEATRGIRLGGFASLA